MPRGAKGSDKIVLPQARLSTSPPPRLGSRSVRLLFFWLYDDSTWRLAELRAEDVGHRPDYERWCREPVDGDFVCGYNLIPGRAVTCWSVGTGVSLMGFSPPGTFGTPAWLADDFLDIIQHYDRWRRELKDGQALYLGTMDAVERHFGWKE